MKPAAPKPPRPADDEAAASPAPEVNDTALRVVAHSISQANYLGDRVADIKAIRRDHLQTIGCPPAEEDAYDRFAKQTLASLYLVAREARPSPTEMRRLALRYALDARRSIDGDLNRFAWTKERDGWRIAEDQFACGLGGTDWKIPVGIGTATRLIGLPNIAGRLVRDPFAVAVLDCVLANPPRIDSLKGLIEKLPGKMPTAEDAIPVRPHFFRTGRPARSTVDR